MVGTKATVRDMRRANRSAILYRVFLDAPVTRNDVARATSLSQASVSNLVADLMAEGLVEEAGQVDSDGGRPRMLLRVSPSYRHVVGVDVGDTGVQVELFDMSMVPLAKVSYPSGVMVSSRRPSWPTCSTVSRR